MRSAVSAVELVDQYFDSLVKSRFIEMFSDYEKVPLTELATINMGQSPESSTYNDQGIGMPFYQGKTEFTDTFVEVKTYCSDPKKVAKPMDILMSVRAPVGAVNLTSQECCIGRGLAAITPKNGLADVWFLFNALKTMEQQISDLGVGSTFKAINKEDMKKIKIPLAPLDLQTQFSSFVNQVDKSKSKMRKLIQDCDLSIFSYFSEVFGDPLINPKKWVVADLSELTSVLRNGHPLNDKDYTEEGVDFLLSQNVWNNHFELEGIKHISKEKHESISDTQLKDKDILITKTGRVSTENSSLGRIAMYRGEDDVVNISGEIFLVRVNEKICPEFLLYVLLTDSYRRYIRSRCPGSTDKRHLYLSIVEKFPIILPPMDKQRSFVEFVRIVETIKSSAIDKLNVEGLSN